MKKLKLAPVAAALFLGACTPPQNNANNAVPGNSNNGGSLRVPDSPAAFTVKATLEQNRSQLSLTATHQACTVDGHLFTLNSTHNARVRETLTTPILPQKLTLMEAAYSASFGPAYDTYVRTLTGFQMAEKVKKAVQAGGGVAPLSVLQIPQFPEELQDAAAKQAAIQAASRAADALYDGLEKNAQTVLKGNIRGALFPGQHKYTVSDKPSPLCKP